MFDSMYQQWATTLAPWVTPAIWLAVVTIPSGIILMAWAARRRLYRRNFAGVQRVNGYGHLLWVRLIEGVAATLGMLFFSAGLVAAVFVAWFQLLRAY